MSERRLRHGEPLLRVAGAHFARELVCARCGHRRRVLRLVRPAAQLSPPRLSPRGAACRRCGGPIVPVGFALAEEVSRRALPARALAAPLRTLGLRAGDVVTLVAGGRAAHLEIDVDGT
ncbi:MAG TPA: hypothetical protein VMS86_14795 [Thermoanaerobaculia bacterium]|nr:hypothetical protein [Thermoanaerobaculia bacterium]